jgi:hypothetical protein
MNPLKQIRLLIGKQWGKHWVARKDYIEAADTNKFNSKLMVEQCRITTALLKANFRLQDRVEKLEKQQSEDALLKQQMLAEQINNLELRLRLEQRNRFQFNAHLN